MTSLTATATKAEPFQRSNCWLVPVVLEPQDIDVIVTSLKLFGAGASALSVKPNEVCLRFSQLLVAALRVRLVPSGALFGTVIVATAVLLFSPVSSSTWTFTMRVADEVAPAVVFLNVTCLIAASYCARVAVPLIDNVIVPPLFEVAYEIEPIVPDRLPDTLS